MNIDRETLMVLSSIETAIKRLGDLETYLIPFNPQQTFSVFNDNNDNYGNPIQCPVILETKFQDQDIYTMKSVDADFIFQIPLKSLIELNLVNEHNTPIITEDWKIQYKGNLYSIRKIVPFLPFKNVFLIYKFYCNIG